MSKEEMREGFEAWHCEQYKTHGMTGAPTRDMHNGVRDENYCSKKSQALWECWQETGGDVAKVEALKDEIERIEAGAQPVTLPSCKAKLSMSHDWDQGYSDGWGACLAEISKLGPLYTRANPEEIERMRIDLELTRLARQGDQIEIDGLKALCDGFRAQLADAAQSLETISRLAGRDEFMEDMVDVRGYANSRAIVARGALSVIGEPPAPAAAECTSCDGSGEYIDAIGDWRGYCSCPAGVELKNRPAPVAMGAIAEQKCETCHDQGEVFVSKGKYEYGALTEPEPIYKPCPDCAEPANQEGAQ